MKYLSLFSGIGGFELGITQAYELHNRGLLQGEATEDIREDSTNTSLGQTRPTCIGFSEIDKYAVSIYQKHFPEHKNYGDITKINTSELPAFDLLVGGFPCQAFSIAGKRKGFDDTRGTLFFEIARILRDKQPRLFLLENVKGLLSHDNGRTFSTIISTLDELGYDLQWQVLNSKNFGVPQNRERVFIIGHLRGTSRPQVFPIGESNPIHLREITSNVSDSQRIYDTTGVGKTLKGLGGGLGAKTGLYAVKASHRNGIRGAEISPTLDTMYKKGFPGLGQDRAGAIAGSKIRRLTPTECERLQGFPDGWTEGVSDTQRYKTLGNAVTVNVIREIVKRMI